MQMSLFDVAQTKDGCKDAGCYHRVSGLEKPEVCDVAWETPPRSRSVKEVRGGASCPQLLRLREDGGGGEHPRGSLWR